MARDLRLSLVVAAQDRASKPIKRIQKHIDRLVRRTGLERLGMRLRDAGRGFENLAASASKNALLVGAAVGAMAGSLTLLTGNYASTADRLAKQSRRLDIPIEKLQELEYMGMRAGMSGQQTGKGLEYFSRSLSEAERNSKGMKAQMFKDMGIDIYDAEGNLKHWMDVFYEFMDALDQQPDKSNAIDAAANMFGRSGIGFVNAAEGGRKGIEDVFEDYRNINAAPITEAMADKAEEFEDTKLDLMQSIGGLRNAIVSEYMPEIIEAMEGWQTWVTENTPNIAAAFREITNGISDDFSSLVAWIRRTIAVLGEYYEKLEEHVPFVKQFREALQNQTDGWFKIHHAVYAAGAGILLMFKFVRKGLGFIGKAVWWIFKKTVWAGIIAGIAGVAGAIYKLYQASKAGRAARNMPRGSGQNPGQATSARKTGATRAPRQTARAGGAAWQFGGGKNPAGGASGSPKAPQAPRTMQAPKAPSFTRVRTATTPKQQARMAQQWQAPRGSGASFGASGPWGAPKAPTTGSSNPGQMRSPIRPIAVRQSSRFQQLNRGMQTPQSGSGVGWARIGSTIARGVLGGSLVAGGIVLGAEAAVRSAAQRHRGSAGPDFNPTFDRMQETFRPTVDVNINVSDDRVKVSTSTRNPHEDAVIKVNTGYTMPDVMTISP